MTVAQLALSEIRRIIDSSASDVSDVEPFNDGWAASYRANGRSFRLFYEDGEYEVFPVSDLPQQDSEREDDSSPVKRIVRWRDWNVGLQYLPWDRRHGKRLPCGYGHIRNTRGDDGMALDCYYRGDSPSLYVIDQLGKDGSFDEYKLMIGFSSSHAAEQTYQSLMPSWAFGGIKSVGLDWLRSRTTEKLLKADAADLKSRLQKQIETRERLTKKTDTSREDGRKKKPEGPPRPCGKGWQGTKPPGCTRGRSLGAKLTEPTTAQKKRQQNTSSGKALSQRSKVVSDQENAVRLKNLGFDPPSVRGILEDKKKAGSIVSGVDDLIQKAIDQGDMNPKRTGIDSRISSAVDWNTNFPPRRGQESAFANAIDMAMSRNPDYAQQALTSLLKNVLDKPSNKRFTNSLRVYIHRERPDMDDLIRSSSLSPYLARKKRKAHFSTEG